ncbi:hypothetical protein PRIPAC_85496 [Pristionchus pacificus]|uniref:Uncharacterized protein n=1 Tax=Pristionchus pacificus TaxID=54126 RepID=A0A2A6BME1_PRIPA|nr:hypothetical protein PRIPAC_85496 [Pristionchus pacificus]|eukprot:PDM67070.1 hypothetical protein PRIPAC_48487 [Pristionchus pacificus]
MSRDLSPPANPPQPHEQRYEPAEYSTCPPQENDRKYSEQRDNSDSTKDYLSSLVKDCMRSIITRLDKNDVDKFLTVSKHFNEVATECGATARNPQAHSLTVTSEAKGNTTTRFSMDLDRTKYFMLLSDANQCTKFRKTNQIVLSTADHPVVADVIAARLSRFDYRICIFVKICINEHFLDYFEKVTSTFSAFQFESCTFDTSDQPRLIERLREIIIAAKPNLISLQYVIAPGFIDQTFLTRYSESVPLPAFMSFMSASFRVDPNFTAAISRFRSLVMCHQMIASDGLLVALTVHFFERLRRKINGNWSFRITENVIAPNLFIELENSQSDVSISHTFNPATNIENSHIDLVGTGFRVSMKCVSTRGLHEGVDRRVWAFSADFTSGH